MTDQNAPPFPIIKKRPAPASLFVNRNATSRRVFIYKQLWTQVRVRGVASRFTSEAKVPISVDIGFDDVIYPERIRMDFPVLLDMEIPNIYAYTIYSVLAEKFEAIVSLGLANSRYKDFYDIYAIATEYDLSGSELVQAIKETFKHRKTGYDDIVLFQDDFTSDPVRQNRWLAFIKKKKATLKISFTETTDFLKGFLSPVVNAIRLDEAFEKQWNCKSQEWI